MSNKIKKIEYCPHITREERNKCDECQGPNTGEIKECNNPYCILASHRGFCIKLYSPRVKEIKTQIFSVIAEIAKVETMDSGLKMVIYTNEVAPPEMALLMATKGKQGNMLFAPAKYKFSDEDLKDLPEVEVEKGEKHPSQRLRAVLFRLWEQRDPNKTKTSDEYYRDYMSRLIDKIKEQLN